MKKGTLLKTERGDLTYQVIGRWDKDIVLMPICETDDQVLIFGPGELDELIEKGRLRILQEVHTEGGQ